MRDKLLAQDRIEAIQEEIAGFLLDQVIDPKGEYYYPLPPPWTTCHRAPKAPRQHVGEIVYVWIINGGGCETFDDIYLYIYAVLRENLFIYMHNVYNM